jgi:hypothetical protein
MQLAEHWSAIRDIVAERTRNVEEINEHRLVRKLITGYRFVWRAQSWIDPIIEVMI